MSAQVNEILGRRAVLISRAAMQRDELSRRTAALEPGIRIIDGVFRTGKNVRKHSVVASSITAFLLATQWRKLAKLPKRLYQAYLLLNVFRSVRTPSLLSR